MSLESPGPGVRGDDRDDNDAGDFGRIVRHVRAGTEVRRRLPETCGEDILAAAKAIAQALQGGNKLLLCGNGGSAADSQHIAAEFVSSLRPGDPRPALPALALTTDTSFLTAFANDFDFAGVFARQVQALGTPGDVLMGISTSGDSENVVKAAARARANGIFSVGLTGRDGGKLAALSDICIRVPSGRTQLIQEAHIAIGHILCDLVEGYCSARSGR